MNENFKIEIEVNPNPKDVAIVDHGLVKFNAGNSGEKFDYQPLVIFLRNEDREIVGGLLGASIWGWLEIKSLWVDSHLRELGFGSKLMRVAETEAITRDCSQVMLDTFSFQALEFYRKLGYTVFGKLDNFPNGHTRYFLRKNLN